MEATTGLQKPDEASRRENNRPSQGAQLSRFDEGMNEHNTSKQAQHELHAELARTYLQFFENTGELDNINSAIRFMGNAISITPQGDSGLLQRVLDLSRMHDSRYERSGQLADLDKAIDLEEKAISLTPQGHLDMPTRFSTLGALLRSRFKRLGRLVDLNKAIECGSQAMSLTGQDHSDLPKRLSNLGMSLQSRFMQLGDITDLDKAIEYTKQAVSLTPPGHPDMPNLLSNFSSALCCRFDRLSKRGDLDEAIDSTSLAVSLTSRGDSMMPNFLNNLGALLSSRFAESGELADLDKATKTYNQAISLTPQGHITMPIRLGNLGSLLFQRFQREGELSDLDQSIKYHNRAVSLTPQGHPDMPLRLNNLGISLKCRFHRLGEIPDLEVAIEHQQEAVVLAPQGHSDMPALLGNLGSLLGDRYHRLGELSDLEDAIEYNSQAVLLTPRTDSRRPTRLNNLGSALNSRFHRFRESADLEKAIEYQSEAVSLTPIGHAEMPTWLGNLGRLLLNRYIIRGDLADREKAIECHNQAVSLTPLDHAHMPFLLGDLGTAYRCIWGSLHKLTDVDIDKSLECYRKTAESPIGSPSERFRAALYWARACVEDRPPSALIAYKHAISLLPQVVWLGNTVGNRYQNIIDVGGVTTEAVDIALEMGQLDLAMEWLEEGRSIVWKQMLQLRTPVDDLAAVDSELALELQQVARDLDVAGSPKPMDESVSSNNISLEQAAQQHRRLAKKWETTVEKVRKKPGFEAFLHPLKLSKLVESAQSGPVVMVNLDKVRCDAFILRPGMRDVVHVPLELTYKQAAKDRTRLDQLVRGGELTERYFANSKRSNKDSLESTLNVLWIEVVKPVLVSLDYMTPSSSGELPHITWCTTGPLAFLPLHAAGDYNRGEMVFNYVVSSYTPTLSALLRSPSSEPFSGLMTVGQSFTLGLPPLPGTVVELDRIAGKSQGHLVTRIENDLATPSAVLAGMETHGWVHLACHAVQNTTNPLQSAFYLHGGTLDLATITQRRLKHADFAFLSACQTATGDESLSDEAVHLAAGMLMAGFKTVIATMWSIGDKDAPLIAEEVYGHLLEGGAPDARKAAVAVHKATKRLREKVGMKAFASWVPYIHIGM